MSNKYKGTGFSEFAKLEGISCRTPLEHIIFNRVPERRGGREPKPNSKAAALEALYLAVITLKSMSEYALDGDVTRARSKDTLAAIERIVRGQE